MNDKEQPHVERTGQSKYEIGQAYYRMGLAHEWGLVSSPETPNPPVIDTWFYQGYFKLDWNTMSCDVPHHFHVFQPFVPREVTIERPPEQGLRIPSLREVELSMLTLDELARALADMKTGGGS